MYILGFQKFQHIVIFEQRRIQRIMVHKEKRLVLRHLPYLVLQPEHAFPRHQSRSHPDVRATWRSKELYSTGLKLKPFVSEYAGKGIGSALTPGGIVVARNNEPRHFQLVKYILRRCNFIVRAKVRNIASYQNKLNIRILVDILHAIQSSLLRRRSHRNMHIAHNGKLKATVLLCRNPDS